jgi:hypothetical protein
MIEGMERECNDIKKGALRMAWYMRGGASYEDILNMSQEERNTISSIIESNLETTKSTSMPFF